MQEGSRKIIEVVVSKIPEMSSHYIIRIKTERNNATAPRLKKNKNHSIAFAQLTSQSNATQLRN
jgi:hypothetical protein